MQHFLKSAPGAADAEVVAAELLQQFDIAMDDADAALHAGFGRVGLPTLARDLKRTAGRRCCAWSWSWHPPSGCGPRRPTAKAGCGQGGSRARRADKEFASLVTINQVRNKPIFLRALFNSVCAPISL